MLLFGGFRDGTFLNDTWAFDGTDWTPVTTAASPPARMNAVMEYFPSLGKTVLFGGASSFTTPLNGTWEFDGRTWTPLPSTGAPATRFGAAMTFDAARDRLALFGGRKFGDFQGCAPCADTHTFVPDTIPNYHATLDLTGAPAVWAASKLHTFPVQVQNTGMLAWLAGGATPVRLRARSTGGAWQNVSLPADVAAGGSATLSVAIYAPGSNGPATLEAEMVNTANALAFGHASRSVTVQPPLAATLDLSGVPGSWTADRSQTFPVGLTNTGGVTWQTSGPDRVVVRARIGARPSVFTELPASVAPDASTTVTVTLTAPATEATVSIDVALVYTASTTVFATDTATASIGSRLQGTIDTANVATQWRRARRAPSRLA